MITPTTAGTAQTAQTNAVTAAPRRSAAALTSTLMSMSMSMSMSMLLGIGIGIGSLGSSAADRVPELHGVTTQFGDRLTAELYKDPNEFTSALGVSMAFSLVYPSMEAESLQQTEDVLGFSTPQAQAEAKAKAKANITNTNTNVMASNATNAANATNVTMTTAAEAPPLQWESAEMFLEASNNGTCLGGRDCTKVGPKLSISNIIYTDERRTLNPEYKFAVGNLAREADFSNAEETAEEINDWVDNATNGLISEIIDADAIAGLVLIAINAIYLKASWAAAFLDLFTSDDLFYTSPSRTTNTTYTQHFMHQVGLFPYYQTADTQVLEMPFFGSDSLSMVFCLPMTKGNATDDDAVVTVTASDVVELMIPKLEKTRVAVALPKFKITATYSDSLESALKEIGLSAPFEGGLCYLEDDCSSAISTIIQKTYLSVDEGGVEAAAVTALITRTSLPILPRSEPVIFQADHPMQFFIVDKQTKLVLFEGRYGEPVQPTSSDDDEKPVLTARHADIEEFWNETFGYTKTIQAYDIFLQEQSKLEMPNNSTDDTPPTDNKTPDSSGTPVDTPGGGAQENNGNDDTSGGSSPSTDDTPGTEAQTNGSDDDTSDAYIANKTLTTLMLSLVLSIAVML